MHTPPETHKEMVERRRGARPVRKRPKKTERTKLMAKRKGKNLSVSARLPKYEGRGNTKKPAKKKS
jgi:hypothetical protein